MTTFYPLKIWLDKSGYTDLLDCQAKNPRINYVLIRRLLVALT